MKYRLVDIDPEIRKYPPNTVKFRNIALLFQFFSRITIKRLSTNKVTNSKFVIIVTSGVEPCGKRNTPITLVTRTSQITDILFLANHIISLFFLGYKNIFITNAESC
jgi:Golgi nucleoside diphosphatase